MSWGRPQACCLGEPNGCLNDAPCSSCTRHGASIKPLFGAGLARGGRRDRRDARDGTPDAQGRGREGTHGARECHGIVAVSQMSATMRVRGGRGDAGRRAQAPGPGHGRGSIGGGAPGAGRARRRWRSPGERAVVPFCAAVSAGICLGNVCSCHEILRARRPGSATAAAPPRPAPAGHARQQRSDGDTVPARAGSGARGRGVHQRASVPHT